MILCHDFFINNCTKKRDLNDKKSKRFLNLDGDKSLKFKSSE